MRECGGPREETGWRCWVGSGSRRIIGAFGGQDVSPLMKQYLADSSDPLVGGFFWGFGWVVQRGYFNLPSASVLLDIMLILDFLDF